MSRRNPALSKVNTPVVRKFRSAVDAIWIDALCATGYERQGVKSFVKITHYLLRGMAFASVFQSRKSEFSELLDTWLHMGRRELKRI